MPAVKPPTCAQNATPEPALSPIDATPLRSWIPAQYRSIDQAGRPMDVRNGPSGTIAYTRTLG